MSENLKDHSLSWYKVAAYRLR